MQSLQECDGGIAAVLASLRRNGSAGLVEAWAEGREKAAAPDAIERGLRGTGLIECTARRAGVTPQAAAAGIAAMLPMLIRNVAPTGEFSQKYGMKNPSDEFLSRVA